MQSPTPAVMSEREAFITWVTTEYPNAWHPKDAAYDWDNSGVTSLAWQAGRASLSAQAAEPVAQIVSSGPANFPILQWLSADHSFRAPIGSMLYAAPPPATGGEDAARLQAEFDAYKEGSEQAFADVVDEKRRLKEELRKTEENLRHCHVFIAKQSATLAALRSAAVAGAEALQYLGGTLHAQRLRDAAMAQEAKP